MPLRLDVVKFESPKAPLHLDVVKVQENSKAPVLHFNMVCLNEATASQAKLQNLPVATDVAVTLDGKPGKVADLKAGMAVDLGLAAEDGRLVIKSIQARQDGAKK